MQCMQSAGDLIYVPEGYWHGTVNLGETIGVSGQFVRNTGKWAQQASDAVGEGRWDDAAELYRLMLTTPGPHDKACMLWYRQHPFSTFFKPDTVATFNS